MRQLVALLLNRRIASDELNILVALRCYAPLVFTRSLALHHCFTVDCTHSAALASPSHLREAVATEHKSLIMHVAQLSLPGCRCAFFSLSRMSSRTSSGNAAKISPGALLIRFCLIGAGRCQPASGFRWLRSRESKLVKLDRLVEGLVILGSAAPSLVMTVLPLLELLLAVLGRSYMVGR